MAISLDEVVAHFFKTAAPKRKLALGINDGPDTKKTKKKVEERWPRLIDFILDSSSDEEIPVVKPPVKAIPEKQKESSSRAKAPTKVVSTTKPGVSKKEQSSSDDSDSSEDEEEEKPKQTAPIITKPAAKKVAEESSSGKERER